MKRDEIKAGALLSYLNLLIGTLIPFIYTPIMLRMLGQAEYGIYGIALHRRFHYPISFQVSSGRRFGR